MPKMRTVNISLGERSYDIRIAAGLLDKSREILPWVVGNQVLIVTNEIVAPLYLDKVKSALQGKEISEVDQLWVVCNDLIGSLLSRKQNVGTETLFSTRSEVPSFHYSVGRARDHHEPFVDQESGKFNSSFIVRIVFRRPR